MAGEYREKSQVPNKLKCYAIEINFMFNDPWMVFWEHFQHMFIGMARNWILFIVLHLFSFNAIVYQ